ncbi:Copia protein, partial [Mucuna pruriens]
MLNICLCVCFQYDPREAHLIVIKRTFIYLKDSTNFGLFFKKSNEYKLVGYCDEDYARDKIERNRSVNFHGQAKRQGTIALSTTEAKYIAAYNCFGSRVVKPKEDISNVLGHRLEDYNIFESNIPLLCDNIVAINLSKNPRLCSKDDFDIKFISTKHQLIDNFTKSLLKDKLIHIRDLLGLKFIKK